MYTGYTPQKKFPPLLFSNRGLPFQHPHAADPALNPHPGSLPERIWCSGCLHEGCFERAWRVFFVLSSRVQVTLTHSALSERALFRTKGFRGASGEAAARCKNLYVHMVSGCGQNKAATGTCTIQTGHNSPPYRPSACSPGVVQIALFKGFSNVPTCPPPPYSTLSGHKRGNMRDMWTHYTRQINRRAKTLGTTAMWSFSFGCMVQPPAAHV